MVVPGFEEKLRAFWEKNGKVVIVLCLVILAAIIGRGVMGLLAKQRDEAVAAAYAAATTSEQLKTFAAANDGHALAGAAHLRLADEAYAAGRYAEAQTGYTKAAAALAGTPFTSRIQLGLAMTKVSAGDLAGGETALRAVADDLTALKAVRAEAAYHLAVLARDAGRAEDSNKFAERVMSIDTNSVWTQRALMLRARSAAPAAPAAAATAPAASTDAAPAAPLVPAVSFPGSGSK